MNSPIDTIRLRYLLALFAFQSLVWAAPSNLPDPRNVTPSQVDSLMRASSLTTTQNLGTSQSSLPLTLSKNDTARLLRRFGQRTLQTSNPTLFASTGGTVGNDYQVGPGDEFIISVWGQKQASFDVTVDRDGQIFLDGIGMISLTGATFADAKVLIGKKLSGIYSGISSGISHYSVTLGKLKQLRIFVVGDVEKPGGYVFSGASTALQAVAVAGGPTDLGSDRLAIVSRGDQQFDVDLYRYIFLGRKAAKDNLQDGDVVRIPVKKGEVRIEGAVARPGIYEILPEETTSDLLVYAGGLTPLAAVAPITGTRLFLNGRRDAASFGTPQDALSGARKDRLQDGDEIFVQLGTSRSQASLFVSGAVRYPGAYPYQAKTTLAKLLGMSGGVTERALTSRAIIVRKDSVGKTSVLRSGLEQAAQIDLYPMDSVVIADRIALDSTSTTVTISGAVRNPGQYEWLSGMRIKDLGILAGGFLPQADLHSIRVDRKDPTGIVVKSTVVDLDTNLSPSSRDAVIEPSSLVSVPSLPGWSPLRTVVLGGLFNHPETYSLNGESEPLASVVARAGGPLPSAYLDGAILLRKGVGRIQFDLKNALKRSSSIDNLLLIQGDSLMLPPRPATVFVRGQVRKPSHVVWHDGEDPQWYVEMAGGYTDSASETGVYVEYANGTIRTAKQGLKPPDPGSVVTVPYRAPPPKASVMEVLTAVSIVVGVISTAVTTWLLIQNGKN